MARPRVAAGALFLDDSGRVLLVHPVYKAHWDIPGGYVEPGESPLQACRREVHEELAITPTVGALLAVDWAPVEGEGDKLLFIFDGGTLDPTAVPQPHAGEISGWSFVSIRDLGKHVPDRLARRVVIAITAREQGCPTYAEYGAAVS